MREGEKMRALAELFKRFPGIGQRQAWRFSDFIASADGQYVRELTERIAEVRRSSKQCPECCIRYEEETPTCAVCAQENPDTVIVVEKDIDVHALTASTANDTATHYFILGGLIPIANNDESRVRSTQLLAALTKKQPSEVIIALSVHPDADHTGTVSHIPYKKGIADNKNYHPRARTLQRLRA